MPQSQPGPGRGRKTASSTLRTPVAEAAGARIRPTGMGRDPLLDIVSSFGGRTLTGSERERGDEIGEAWQRIEYVDEFLRASDGARAEHHTRQLSKLHPNFVFSIGLLEVAACAFTQPCDLPPIGERNSHPCWFESRHIGVERRVLVNGDSPANRRDRWISNRLFGEGVISRVPSKNQRSCRVREGVFRREVVDRIGLAHV